MKKPIIRLCALPFHGMDYRSVLSVHADCTEGPSRGQTGLDTALEWGRRSGLSSLVGRPSRLWIEADDAPATRERA